VRVPDEGFFKKTTCTLNLISAFLVLLMKATLEILK